MVWRLVSPPNFVVSPKLSSHIIFGFIKYLFSSHDVCSTHWDLYFVVIYIFSSSLTKGSTSQLGVLGQSIGSTVRRCQCAREGLERGRVRCRSELIEIPQPGTSQVVSERKV